MGSIKDLLTTTVLMPASDSLVSSNALPPTKIVEDIQTFSKAAGNKPAATIDQYQVKLTSNGKTVETVMVQSVKGLSVSRGVEKIRSGGEALYETKLPGRISYGEVIFNHLYTNSTVFLDWMFNGSSQGGALLADIEIKVGDKENGWAVYTLRDAFPISWRLGNVNIITVTEVDRYKSMQVKDGQIPIEEVTVVYGKMEFSAEKGSNS